MEPCFNEFDLSVFESSSLSATSLTSELRLSDIFMDDQTFQPGDDLEPGGDPEPHKPPSSIPSSPQDAPERSLPFADVPSMQLGTALSRVPPPLAEAAQAAATQPYTLQQSDDLHDLLGHISWNTDLDPFLPGDTQYLQLEPDATTSDQPNASSPAIPPNQSSSSAPKSPPKPVRRKPAEISKRRRAPTSTSKSPVPIAPRGKDHAQKRKHAAQSPAPPPLEQEKSLPDNARSSEVLPSDQTTVSASSPLDAARPAAMTPTLTSGLPANQFPLPVPPQGVQPFIIPSTNIGACMYPLQHHQPVLQPHGAQLDSKEQSEAIPRSASGNTFVRNNSKKLRVSEVPSSKSLPAHPTPQFMPAMMPFMQTNMMGLDPNMLPFFQMAAAQQLMAVATGYPPTGVVPPPSARCNMSPNVVGAAGPGSVNSMLPDEKKQDPTGGVNKAQVSTKRDLPVVVSEEGSTYLVPQQAAARLERHPVLGRLQLQSMSKDNDKSTDNGSTKTEKDTKNGGASGSPRRNCGSNVSISQSKGGPLSSAAVGQGDGERPNQKKRLVWTPELHERFLKAIDAVGIAQAVPRTLVTIMNVEGLTTEHVKSHLQKYRNSLRKEADEDERERMGQRGVGNIGSESARRTASLRGGNNAQVGHVGQFAVAANAMTGFNVPVQTFPATAQGAWVQPANVGADGTAAHQQGSTSGNVKGKSQDASGSAMAEASEKESNVTSYSKPVGKDGAVPKNDGEAESVKDGSGAEKEKGIGDESEEVKEELQQMQLQLQVMVHRTLALQRKMQQSQSAVGTGESASRAQSVAASTEEEAGVDRAV